jgi:hypothetical protein
VPFILSHNAFALGVKQLLLHLSWQFLPKNPSSHSERKNRLAILFIKNKITIISQSAFNNIKLSRTFENVKLTFNKIKSILHEIKDTSEFMFKCKCLTLSSLKQILNRLFRIKIQDNSVAHYWFLSKGILNMILRILVHRDKKQMSEANFVLCTF